MIVLYCTNCLQRRLRLVRIVLPAHDPSDLRDRVALQYVSTTGVCGELERLLACTDAEVGLCCDNWCTSACYACGMYTCTVGNYHEHTVNESLCDALACVQEKTRPRLVE